MHRIISIVKRDSFATNDREYRCYEFVTSAITKINDRDHGWLKRKTMFWSCKISSRSSFSSQFFSFSLSLFHGRNQHRITIRIWRWGNCARDGKSLGRNQRPSFGSYDHHRNEEVVMSRWWLKINERKRIVRDASSLVRPRGPMDILAYHELRCAMHQYRDSCVLFVTLNTNIESNKFLEHFVKMDTFISRLKLRDANRKKHRFRKRLLS